MTRDKEINLRVGKGTQRGEVSISTLLPEVLTLRVSYKGGRPYITAALPVQRLSRPLQSRNVVVKGGDAFAALSIGS